MGQGFDFHVPGTKSPRQMLVIQLGHDSVQATETVLDFTSTAPARFVFAAVFPTATAH